MKTPKEIIDIYDGLMERKKEAVILALIDSYNQGYHEGVQSMHEQIKKLQEELKARDKTIEGLHYEINGRKWYECDCRDK